MTRPEIQDKLLRNHEILAELIHSLNDRDFLYAENGKWTAGQQLDHIRRSVRALNQALLLPKFVLKLIIGKANRPSKNYEDLVAKYQLKLQAGGRATGAYLPPAISVIQKKKLKVKLLKTVHSLIQKVSHYNEKQLDDYILPHPLLGKLTMREMLYFTIYHAEHHLKITRRNLGK